jgi:hypothetical protein
MREPLLFSGIRWSGAKVVRRGEVVGTSIFTGKKVPFYEALIIETTGNGRPYTVTHAEGWWRDLAELSLDDERRVLSFLARRGDPFGQLAPDGTQITTHGWLGLKAALGHAATAWTPLPDETGVSRFRPEMLEIAERFLHPPNLGTEWTNQLSVVYDGLLPVLSTKVLAAYMCAAAAASLRGGLDMRRCDYCSSWFTLHYVSARQCSASCRAARFNNRRSPHGFVPQDHDSQGSDSVAEPLAGAGNERPPAGQIAELRNPEGSGGARRPDARNRKPRRRRPAPT